MCMSPVLTSPLLKSPTCTSPVFAPDGVSGVGFLCRLKKCAQSKRQIPTARQIAAAFGPPTKYPTAVTIKVRPPEIASALDTAHTSATPIGSRQRQATLCLILCQCNSPIGLIGYFAIAKITERRSSTNRLVLKRDAVYRPAAAHHDTTSPPIALPKSIALTPAEARES